MHGGRSVTLWGMTSHPYRAALLPIAPVWGNISSSAGHKYTMLLMTCLVSLTFPVSTSEATKSAFIIQSGYLFIIYHMFVYYGNPPRCFAFRASGDHLRRSSTTKVGPLSFIFFRNSHIQFFAMLCEQLRTIVDNAMRTIITYWQPM